MRRVVLTAAVAGSIKADRPRKRLVETAHPRLQDAWAATGVLTEADFEAARADGAPYSVRRSLLGDVDDMPASDCGDDRKRAGAEWCFNGTDPGDMDDDWARTDLMGLNPGACATCGFIDGPLNNNGLPAGLTDPWTPATWPFDWPYDCVTCEDPSDELVVFYRDCTGACVDAAGVEELRALGFGTLDESGCYAKRGCYPEGFLDAYSVEGVNNYFFEDRVAVEQTCVPTCPDGTDGVACGGDDYCCDGAYVCSNDGVKSPTCCDLNTMCWGNVRAYCVSPLDERLGYLPDSRDCWAACVQREGDRVVAIDVNVAGECYCQTDCTCMREGDGLNGARTYLVTRDSLAELPGPCNEDGRAVGTEPVPCTQYLGDGPYPAGPPRAGTKKSGPATAAGGLAIKVLIAAAVVVAACCCCAMAVGLGTAATLGREEDDDPPEQVREIQLHGLRPWKAPDGDNVVVGG